METLIVGQVAEFLVWAELVAQSQGHLHPYLPLWDRGIDGLIHRRADGTYIPVQVKSRTVLDRVWARYRVPAESLSDDSALLICVFLEGDQLGPGLMVIPEGDFKRLAVEVTSRGRRYYIASINFNRGSQSHWHPHVIPTDQLAQRLGYEPELGLPAAPRRLWRAPTNRPLGIAGEAEVIQALAGREALNIFRPFPDLETAELVARHVSTFGTIGLQVKTVTVHSPHRATTVNIQRPSFVPSPNTWVVALAWAIDEGRFHPECLLLPTSEVERLARLVGKTYQIQWHPGGRLHARIEPYRIPLAELGDRIERLLWPSDHGPGDP